MERRGGEGVERRGGGSGGGGGEGVERRGGGSGGGGGEVLTSIGISWLFSP